MYTAPCIMFLMLAGLLRGQVGRGWGPGNLHMSPRHAHSALTQYKQTRLLLSFFHSALAQYKGNAIPHIFRIIGQCHFADGQH